MAFVVALISLVVVLVLGLAVVQNSVSGLRTSGNDSTSKNAAAIAESGAEYAREAIRTQLKGGQTINQLLSTAANAGNLVDATTLGGFGHTTATANGTNNRPVVASRAFGAGNFQVFLTNDPLEGGTQTESVKKTTDSNNRIMITSFAGRAGSASVVQEQLGIFDAFLPGRSLPGMITLPGPDVNFQSFASNARMVYGYAPGQVDTGPCFPTIAVTTNAAKSKIDAIMCTPGNSSTGQYTSCKDSVRDFTNPAASCITNGNGNGGGSTGTEFNPTTENFLLKEENPYDTATVNNPILRGDPRLTQVSYLDSLKAKVIQAANCKSASECSSPYGTTTSPMIVAINGDFTLKGTESGVGILLVTGKLTFSGTPDYTGLVLVIGQGNFEQNGAGNGTVRGAMLVANTNTPWVGNAQYVGIPTYNINGGGNSESYYDAGALTRYAAGSMPLQVLTFRFLH
jgi:Tfp pilus assembly protein PilX